MDIPLKQSGISNTGHSSMVLFFLYVCPRVVLLGKSYIALFTFGYIGGDTFEAVKEEQYWSQRFCCFYKCVLWLCLQGTIFWTLLRRFCYFYMCVLRLCFKTNIMLLCLHLDFHLHFEWYFVIQGEIPLKQSKRNKIPRKLFSFCMCVLRLCF